MEKQIIKIHVPLQYQNDNFIEQLNLLFKQIFLRLFPGPNHKMLKLKFYVLLLKLQKKLPIISNLEELTLGRGGGEGKGRKKGKRFIFTLFLLMFSLLIALQIQYQKDCRKILLKVNLYKIY